MRGWLTQLGTRICWRLLSYATAYGLPKPLVSFPAGALRMIRFGAALPAASRGNTSAVWSPKFATKISSFAIATPIGPLMPVAAPRIARFGCALPFAVRAKTRTELSPLFATNSSLFASSTATPIGQSIWLRGPAIVRSGAMSPFASPSYTVMDDATKLPRAVSLKALPLRSCRDSRASYAV